MYLKSCGRFSSPYPYITYVVSHKHDDHLAEIDLFLTFNQYIVLQLLYGIKVNKKVQNVLIYFLLLIAS